MVVVSTNNHLILQLLMLREWGRV